MNITRTRLAAFGVFCALLLTGCGKDDFDFESVLILGVGTAVLAFIFGFLSIILAGLIGAAGGGFIAYTLDTTLFAHYAIACIIGGLLGLFLGAIAKGFTSGGGSGVLDDIGDIVDFTD